MVDVNLSSPIEVRNAGMKALQEALGTVEMVKFMQQYDMGYGDYTKEKQEQPDMSLEEIDTLSFGVLKTIVIGTGFAG